MKLFRKNYLPKVSIRKSLKGFWYAYIPGDATLWTDWWKKSFCENENGGYDFYALEEPTMFDSLDELMEALYFYTYKLHLEELKKEIEENMVKVQL